MSALTAVRLCPLIARVYILSEQPANNMYTQTLHFATKKGKQSMVLFSFQQKLDTSNLSHIICTYSSANSLQTTCTFKLCILQQRKEVLFSFQQKFHGSNSSSTTPAHSEPTKPMSKSFACMKKHSLRHTHTRNESCKRD